MMSGLSNPYQLDKSIFNFRACLVIFVFIQVYIGKLISPIKNSEDTVELTHFSCHIIQPCSGSALFAYVPKIRSQG